MKIDEQIRVIDKAICRHIDQFDVSSRGAVSQDILKNLRDLVEHIMLKIYAQGSDIDDNWDTIQKAVKYVKTKSEWKDLTRFHGCLQKSVSHYTIDEENSERLMLKYYVFLLKLKKSLADKFSIDILSNIDKFPLNTDTVSQEYYDKIAEKVKQYALRNVNKSDKYYIQKIKPFFFERQIFYEVTFTPANDYASKFDRVIAFTSLEISDFYAVKLTLVNSSISILEKTMPITIIVGWEVAIRDCEFKNFSKIIRGKPVFTALSEQQGLCRFLTATGLSLVELIDFTDEDFNRVKIAATQRAKSVVFFADLETCRSIIGEDKAGSNLLRYLLLHLNNKVIKKQQQASANANLSGLFAQNGCIPFDRMPFNASLLGHNPKLGDLFFCIDSSGREHELLARLVKNNTEIQGQLFTPIEDIVGFADIEGLVNRYNATLWFGHREQSKLVIKNGYIFINGYKDDTLFILNELENLSKDGVQNYENSVRAWLSESNHGVDCEEKKEALIQIFKKSKVALIYGSAGTGKSTLINHIAHFFADKNKLFLAQTNPAVDNLKRRVTASNCTFLTITKFLKRKNATTEYDLLFIDECSTVNNRDMRDIITKATYKLLVLVGDSYQIASIRFGNWFCVARDFVPDTAVFELTRPYRSKNEALLTLWDRVRKMDDTILELIARKGYSATLDKSIFSSAEDDEIILCLNYDGLYGINNFNRFLQEANPSKAVPWGIQQFKVNDPVLFNESERFAPVIYNNMKGRIVDISILDEGIITERIQFDVEVDKVINGVDAFGQNFELLGNADNGNSIIRFCVNKTKSEDEDDDGSLSSVMPFQVAYAVSIHKAQGLEYESVKIVITDEVGELITHNIFYTAITRARNKLKIYWTPEVEKKVLESIKPRNIDRDVALLKAML